MMRIAAAAWGFALCLLGGLAAATPAPDFRLPDARGKTHTLEQYRGRYVVLEWLNHGCPFVRKHYGSGNMQALQKRAAADGVVWLSVVSSAPGTQGYGTGPEHLAAAAKTGAAPAAILMDSTGGVGRAYGARTTPNMYVIDPRGELIYQGAIDDQRSADPATVTGARNYVLAALDAARSGKVADPAATQPYGCSIKYR